ncbi:MAG: oligosaccharide flippase family protein [Chloroflexi bacterium]|nr:oligosaccharide flippase family protein [Chloroflexota bacterium]
MNSALRVLKNSSSLTISALLERSIAFLLPLYVARIMGREIWGDFSTAQTFVAIAANLSTWGLIGLLPRKIARSRDHAGKLFLNSTFIGTGITIILMFLTVLVVYLLNYPPSISRLIYTGVFLVLLPQTEANLYEAAILGLEHMEWMVMVRFPITIIRVAVSIYMLSIGYEIEILFPHTGAFLSNKLHFYILLFLFDMCLIFDLNLIDN